MIAVAFPFRIDAGGRTAGADAGKHVRDLLEQTLLTAAGERVNRPGFGTGLQQLVFAPNSPEVAMATQFLVQGALQQHLGELIQVESVTVAAEDATLVVAVAYTVRRTGQRESTTFSTGGS